MKKKIRSLFDVRVYRFMTLTLAGMIVSLLVDVLVIKKYGAGSITDLYVLINTVPVLLEGIIREGTRTSMVPVFAEYHSEKMGNEKISGVINASVLLGMALFVTLILLARPVAEMIAPGQLLDENREMLVNCFRILLLIVPMAIIGAVLAAVLIVYGENSILAQRNIIPPVLVVAVVIIENDITIELVSWCTTLGYAIYVLLLAVWLAGKGFSYSTRQWPERAVMVKISGAVSWTIIAMVIGQGGRFFERIVLSRLAVGLLAKYYMAFRVVAAVQTLVGHSFAVIGINNLVKNNTVQVLGKNVKAGAVLAMLAVIFIELFAEEIIALLFGRGGLEREAITDVALILRIMAAGLVFQCLIPILELPFYMSKKNSLVALNSLVIVSVKVVLILWLAEEMLANGVAMSLGIASLAGCIIPVMYINRLKRK